MVSPDDRETKGEYGYTAIWARFQITRFSSEGRMITDADGVLEEYVRAVCAIVRVPACCLCVGVCVAMCGVPARACARVCTCVPACRLCVCVWACV